MMMNNFAFLPIEYERNLRVKQDGNDWDNYSLNYINLTRLKNFTQYCSNRYPTRVRKQFIIINFDMSKIDKVIMRRLLSITKKHLKSLKQLFRQINLIWLLATTTSVRCI